MNKISCSLLISAMLTCASPAQAKTLDRNMPADQNDKVVELLQEQAMLLEAFTGGQMQVVVLHTDDPLVREFVARGITKTTPEDFARQENGLAAVTVDGGKINGVKTRACYIVYNKQRAGHVWRNFLVPMAKDGDMSIGAAFLVGHEVAHCLDHYELRAKLGERSAWPVAEAATFGLLADTWRMVGGGDTVSMNSYNQRAEQIYVQRGQMQYAERVADIFGTLWAFSRGAAPDITLVLRKTRVGEDWSTHATVPALEDIEKHADAARMMEAAQMWTLARGLQVQAGVHESVAMNGEKAGAVVIQAKPTPQVNAQQARAPGAGVPTATAAPAPAPQKPAVVNFNNLPKFGRRGFSGN